MSKPESTFDERWDMLMSTIDTTPPAEPIDPQKRKQAKPEEVKTSEAEKEPDTLRSGTHSAVVTTAEPQSEPRSESGVQSGRPLSAPKVEPPAPEKPSAPEVFSMETGDDSSINYEEVEDREADELLVAEITSFAFTIVSIRPKSEIAGNVIKNRMAMIAKRNDLGWNPAGKILILFTKKGVDYTGREMEQQEVAFIRQLIGFLSEETDIR